MIFQKTAKTLSSTALFTLLTLTTSFAIAGTVEDTVVVTAVKAAIIAEEDVPESI